MDPVDTLLSLCVGIGLSAACGFRIFVPMLILGLASMSGHATLAEEFAWVGSTPAVFAFGTAACLEIGAYYIPWLDNALDGVATPCAVVAGTIMTGSVIADMSPYLQWTAAIIVGGGTAGLVQAGSVLLRGVSTGTTGGLANPVLATAELGGSVLMSLSAVFVPVLGIIFVIGAAGWIGRIIYRKRRTVPVVPASSH